jgi:hypothetical protein
VKRVRCYLSPKQQADLANLKHLEEQYERYQACGLLTPLPPVLVQHGRVNALFQGDPVSQPILQSAMGQRREVPDFQSVAMTQVRAVPPGLDALDVQRFQPALDVPPALDVVRFQPALDVQRFQPALDVVRFQPALDVVRFQPPVDVVRFQPPVDVQSPPASPPALDVVPFQPAVDVQSPPAVVRFQAAGQPVVDQRNVQRFLAASKGSASKGSVTITPRPRQSGKSHDKKVMVTVRTLVNHPSADKSLRNKGGDLAKAARRFKTPEYLAKEAAKIMSTPKMVPQVIIGRFDILF